MTGVVQGAVQAATEMTAAPVVATSAVLTPLAMPTAVVAETTQKVAEGLDAVKSLALPEVSINGSSKAWGDQFHAMLAANGDYHSVMTKLAFGDPGETLMGNAGDARALVEWDFLELKNMSPRTAGAVVQQVEGLQLPENMVGDPQFLALFTEELNKDMATQKALLKEGKLSEEEYVAMRQNMLQRSAARAAGRREDASVSENDLEAIKRKAALQAIRQHMMLWRYSVMKDKRLTPEAKQMALQRVDRLEQRLLVQEAIRWDGMSVMKLIALASVWMQETTDK